MDKWTGGFVKHSLTGMYLLLCKIHYEYCSILKFHCRAEEVFGGCSVLLIGDWGQLPPVMDLPLYTTVSRTELSDLGSTDYHLFDKAIVLDQVMRQVGVDTEQQLFRDLLLRLRDGQTMVEDWKHDGGGLETPDEANTCCGWSNYTIH